MAEPERDWYDEEERGLGCYECDCGWKHGCCDDLCRNCEEAQWCDFAIPCRICNPDGDFIP